MPTKMLEKLRSARHIGLVLVAALASGCGERPAAPRASGDGARNSAQGEGAPAHGSPLRATSNAGRFVAQVTPLAPAVPLNEHFAVELALFRADGTTPYTPAVVTLDARMEEHEHGMLRDVALQPLGPGRYRADGLLFHMVGAWQFHVDVTEGARSERAQMDLVLR